jgi:hypothetical protein
MAFRLAVVSLLLLAATPLRGQSAICQVHVVLFVPADVKPPAGYQERIDQIVAYSEAFFQRELKRWGHDKMVMPFGRSPQGRAEVMFMRGKKKLSEYEPVPVRMEVMDELRAQGRTDGGRQVWWILVYAGEPPARFKGFLGGVGPQIGGWAVCNFDTSPGRIDPAAELGSDLLEKIMLKGMIHELGHGFQLPHIGPIDRDKAGNTLMGPTHINWRRVMKKEEDRVYLCEAEAAMLSIHPAFRGETEERQRLPKVDVENMEYTADPQAKMITVRGKLRSPRRAIYALVADESDSRPGEYWTKTYVGKVRPDGAFEVIVTEPAQSNGTLKTWFAFEGGALTGDGKQRSRQSGIAKPYTFDGKTWVLK